MIFVFGSNKAGIHGAGAAKYAHKAYGAEWGVGEGLTGQAYALPTKDENIGFMDLEEIFPHVVKFCNFAKDNPQLSFLLTPVGTGLAGRKMSHMRLLFKKAGLPSNVYLTSTWITDDKGE